MIIAFRSRLSYENLFTCSFWGIVLVTAVFFLYFLVLLMKTPVIEGVMDGKIASSSLKKSEIFTGPLSLKENRRSPLAISLEQKLVLLSQSMRPDLKKEEKCFCIGIQGTNQRRVIREGEAIFAEILPHPSGRVDKISFVEEGAGMKMIPHVLDECSLLLKVDEMEVILKASMTSGKTPADTPGIEMLANAKWWGKDRLFETYGGADYRPLGQKEKLEIGNGVVFVGVGDFLTLKNGKWETLSSLKKASREDPLAHVKSVADQSLVLEAWDKEGFPVFQGELKLQPREGLHLSLERIITDLRMRSAKQISCLVDKKRMTLKEGDWLLKGKSGWTKLKTLNEIEAFLRHELPGELLIVDEIDPNGHLKGNYFDAKRIHQRPIALNVSQTPQKKVSTRQRRRGHLSKL